MNLLILGVSQATEMKREGLEAKLQDKAQSYTEDEKRLRHCSALDVRAGITAPSSL